MNAPHNVGPMGLRVPIAVVRVVHLRWMAGAISDDTIKEIYGDQWLRMFQLWRSHGEEACRVSFAGLVDWSDVEPTDKESEPPKQAGDEGD